MPKLNTFDVVVKTGSNGLDRAPRWCINGFVMDFEQAEGAASPGTTFKGSASPGSFPHTLLLRGPDAGKWEIESAQVTYYPNGEPPYTVRLGAVTLDDDADLNIWHDRPAPVFDV